jgi:hypothetical protein
MMYSAWMMPFYKVRLQSPMSNERLLTWNVTEDGQEDVNEEVGVASSLKEDTKRWEDDGEDDLDDVAKSHRQYNAGRTACWGMSLQICVFAKSAGVRGIASARACAAKLVLAAEACCVELTRRTE